MAAYLLINCFAKIRIIIIIIIPMVKTRKAPRLLPKNVFFDFLLYHFYRMYTLQPQKLSHPVVKKQIIRERERNRFFTLSCLPTTGKPVVDVGGGVERQKQTKATQEQQSVVVETGKG